MLDEAFLPFAEIVRHLCLVGEPISDASAGVSSVIEECSVELPVELDVTRDADGRLQIGSAPPLYYVDTTFRPSFHRLKLRARLGGDDDGG